MSEYLIKNGIAAKLLAEQVDDDIIDVPNGVTALGQMLFYDMRHLKYALLPDTLTQIGEMAFKGCTELSELELPHSLKSIDRKAFGGCSAFMPELPDSLERIGEYAFEDCTALETITIPDKVGYIGTGAFCGCERLREICVSADNRAYTTRDGVLYSRDMKRLICCPAAYEGDIFTIPASVAHIEEAAFYGCGFKRIKLPHNLVGIGAHAFSHCAALERMDLPDTVCDIGACAFNSCEKLSSINIPAGVTQIGDGTFEKCFELKRIRLAEGLQKIGRHAFSGCEALQLDALPERLIEIGDNGFAGCMGLYALTLPQSLMKLGNGAFIGCGNLERFNLPPKLNKAGRYAFYGCPADYILVERRWDDDLSDIVVGITCDAIAYLAGKCDDVPDWFKPLCARGVSWADGDVQLRLRPYRSGWANWIRKHGELLWETAIDDERLMRILIKERAIGEELIDKVLDRALWGDNVAITAMLLEYKRAARL